MAHVLFMDIVAYSMLAIDEQQAILHKLQELVRGCATVQRAQAEDTLIALPTGDGMALVFFGSPESPAQCALELTRALHDYPEIKLRMGIHNGPVYRVADINAARNVAGGGINMAQRVMDCGDAGHILISKPVADVLAQLSTWRNIALHDLGEAEVKHGVLVHIFNLCGDGVGNAELPSKLHAVRKAKTTSLRKKWGTLLAAAVVLLAAVAGWFYYRYQEHRRTTFHEKDTIVLADFDNQTGESGWDATLKLALTKSLEDSQYLNVLPEQTVRGTLKLMKRSPDERVTKEVATQICLRNGFKALLTASIAKMGEQYHLDLRAMNCATGATLASADADAASKEKVIAALKNASNELRQQLGESLAAVQKYSTPLPQATTASLEAIQAYATGLKMKEQQGPEAAVQFYKRAVELDPEFADVYVAMAAAYSDMGQVTLAQQSAEKAYELRDRVSPRERFHIEGDYYDSVTGEIEKANQTYLDWIQVYPDDYRPHQDLGANYFDLGQYDKAVAEKKIVLRLRPNNVSAFTSLMGDYVALGDLNNALRIYDEAHHLKLEHDYLGLYRYYVAFLSWWSGRWAGRARKECCSPRSRTRRRSTVASSGRATTRSGRCTRPSKPMLRRQPRGGRPTLRSARRRWET
jgi:class 3 adenylate cyclase/tetratricopeptide (TPR) repeat protein